MAETIEVLVPGGQADPGSGVHRLQQVIDEPSDALINPGHRRSHDAQARIGVMQDVQLSHKAGLVAARAATLLLFRGI